MSKIDKIYQELLHKIYHQGFEYEDPNRKGIIRKQIPYYNFEHNFEDGFPIIGLKQTYPKMAFNEMKSFMMGKTNLKDLEDLGVTFWREDAYNYYLKSKHKTQNPYDFENWLIEALKECGSDNDGKITGDLGRIYSHQIRNWNGSIDQLNKVLERLKKEPNSTKNIVAMWNPSDLDNCALSPCFTKDTLVCTSNGYKAIQDIKIGESVLTQEGKYEKVYDTMVHKYKGSLIGLKTKGRRDEILCTPNHEFFVKNKGWVNALFIEENDFLAIPINKEKILSNFKYKKVINQKRTDDLEVNLHNIDIWWVMGYFLGDGWLDLKRKRIFFSISDKESDLVIPNLKKIFNALTKSSVSGRSAKYSCNDIGIFELFKNFGHGAFNKTIPYFIVNAPKEYIEVFLNGFRMADGTKTKERLEIGTVSHSLAYGVQLLLSKIGKASTVTYGTPPKYRKIMGRHVVQREKYYSVNEVINLSNNQIVEDNYIWQRVYEKHSYKEMNADVYNLSVQNSPTYSVYNLTTHNCHRDFEFIVENLKSGEKGLRVKWAQSSCDLFLGIPINVMYYSFVCYVFAHYLGMKPLGIIGNLSNVHLYDNSLSAVEKILEFNPNDLEPIEIETNFVKEWKDLDDYLRQLDYKQNIKINNYKHLGRFNVPMLSYSN